MGTGQIALDGAGFGPTTQVQLFEPDGTPHAAIVIDVESPTRIVATFDMGAVPVGFYGVRVSEPGGDAAQLDSVLEVVPGGVSYLETNLIPPASDIFDGEPGNGRYYSESTAFDVTVLGADFMTVYSTNGGNDKLILHDSPGDDVFRAKSHKVELFDRDTGGTVHKITARKFKDVTAYADQGGRDVAKLYDSTLDDLWEAEYRQGETWSKMTSTSRALYEALAFEQVKGYSVNGGMNTLRKNIVAPEVDFVLTYGDWEDAP